MTLRKPVFYGIAAVAFGLGTAALLTAAGGRTRAAAAPCADGCGDANGVPLGFGSAPLALPDALTGTYLRNFDFSQGDGAPANWKQAGDKRITLSREKTDAGTALRITAPQGSGDGDVQSDLFAALPSGPFTLTGQVRFVGKWQKAHIAVQGLDANWGNASWNGADVATGRDDWQEFTIRANFGPDVRAALLHLQTRGAGSVEVRDLRIETENGPKANPNADAKTIGVQASRYVGAMPYRFDSVLIGAGGAVTQMAFHPSDPNGVYMAADVAGPFRRDAKAGRWIATADNYGPQEDMRYYAESVAVDPQDPRTAYYSSGKEWTRGRPDILKTTDGGKTWTPTGLATSDGKEVFITNGITGRRLTVDPGNSRIIYYGSRRDGLFVSRDGAKTWTQAQNFPTEGHPTRGTGVQFVLADKSSVRGGAVQTLYTLVTDAGKAAGVTTPVATGLYRSQDAGRTWQKIDNAPGGIGQGYLDSRGTLYVSGGEGVFRYVPSSQTWQDITPKKGQNYSAVAVSPADPNLIVAMQLQCGWGASLYRSLDGGKSWTAFSDDDFGTRGKQTFGMAHMQDWQGNRAVGGEGPHAFACSGYAEFDPIQPRKLWQSDWYGVFSIPDITAVKPVRRAEYDGHEMVCLFDVAAPKAGASLISGMMDVGGFRHQTPRTMPPHSINLTQQYNATVEDGSSLDTSESDPNVVVCAGGWKYNNRGTAGISRDNGRTWKNFASKPFADAKNGRIAVSATDPDNIVWIPRSNGQTPTYFTRDGGKTWAASKGSPLDVVYGEFVYTFYQPLASDRVKPNTFYLWDRRDGRFYTSTDGGASFTHTATLPAQAGAHFDQHTVRPAPGIAGEVWVAADDKGLFASHNGGATFAKLSGVTRAWRFGWGRPLKTGGKPAAFLLGRVAGDPSLGKDKVALYRSLDMGATWTRVSDPKQHGWGQATVVQGDRQTPGRVYIGTNGRGIFYGDTK